MRKKIVDFTNYSVDENGDVFSKSGKQIYKWTDNTGYIQVVLYKNNKRYYKRVHRLVYEAFNGAIEERFVIDHIDGDKSNNNLDNLEKITRSKNIKYFYENNSIIKYDITVCDLNGKYINRYYSLRSLCEDLKLNRSTVCNILKGVRNNKYPYKFIKN